MTRYSSVGEYEVASCITVFLGCPAFFPTLVHQNNVCIQTFDNFVLLKVAFYFGSSPNPLLQTTLKVYDCVTRKKNVCIAGSHCPLTLFQCLLFLRCFSRVFTKPGMYHFLCTAHHLVDEEV